jgi:hypothetical protein
MKRIWKWMASLSRLDDNTQVFTLRRLVSHGWWMFRNGFTLGIAFGITLGMVVMVVIQKLAGL